MTKVVVRAAENAKGHKVRLAGLCALAALLLVFTVVAMMPTGAGATEGAATPDETSGPAEASTASAMPPDAPAMPVVTQVASGKELAVSWTAPDMTGKPPITGYDLRYKRDSDGGWTSHSFSGVGTSTTLTGLQENTGYDVQVKAINSDGESDWSASGTGTTNTNQPPSFSLSQLGS